MVGVERESEVSEAGCMVGAASALEEFFDMVESVQNFFGVVFGVDSLVDGGEV